MPPLAAVAEPTSEVAPGEADAAAVPDADEDGDGDGDADADPSTEGAEDEEDGEAGGGPGDGVGTTADGGASWVKPEPRIRTSPPASRPGSSRSVAPGTWARSARAAGRSAAEAYSMTDVG